MSLENQHAAALDGIEQEFQRDIANAETTYRTECKAADDEYDRAWKPIQNRYDRVERSSPTKERRAAALRSYMREIRPHEDKHEARHTAARSRYMEAVGDAKAVQNAARKNAENKFDKLRRDREAKAEREREAEDRKRQAAEREREREEQKSAERERKRAERQRVADKFDLARQIAKATTPPVVTISPAQAAARLGMTLAVFWTHVRTGRYPAPRDDNRYEEIVIARLPRPRVRIRHAIPNNVYGQIWRF